MMSRITSYNVCYTKLLRIILIIVTDFASGTAKKQIVTKLIQKALQNNLIWEEFEIIHFVDDAEKLFDIERNNFV